MSGRKKSKTKPKSKAKTRDMNRRDVESQPAEQQAPLGLISSARNGHLTQYVCNLLPRRIWTQYFRNYNWNVFRNWNNQQSEVSTRGREIENENKQFKEKIGKLHDEIDLLKHSVKEKEDQIRYLQLQGQEDRQKIIELTSAKKKLVDEKTSLEKDKEEALRRLSELVSVRLRDNNPNIVDLNDPWRPTKLAEMFSELYDNEWTSAYAVLEGTFTETQAIVILLDTVMEAYEFCEDRMEERWNSLEKWFIDSELPGAQQTCKWLKDSRKATILKKLKEIDADFEELIHQMCKDKEVEKLLSDNTVKGYITKCVELCLLMVTTDPPVILGCPNWEPSKKLSAAEGDEANIDDKGKQDEEVVDEKQPNGDVKSAHKEKKNDINHDHASSTLTVIDETDMLQKECKPESEDMVTKTSADQVTDNNEAVNNGCQSGTDESDNSMKVDIPDDVKGSANKPAKELVVQTVDTESITANGSANEPSKEPVGQTFGTESGIANGTANENGNKQVAQKGLVAVIPKQRSLFEKDTFKEYTTRGKYLDYIVWPALYLHKDGPLLAKGIAQGSKEEFNRQEATRWIWRRKLPSDVE